MKKSTLLLLVIQFSILFIATSLQMKVSEARSVIQLPFRTVRFINDSIFFTTNNGRFFGYINTEKRGEIEIIYELGEDQRILDEFSIGEKLIIGNKNKSMIVFEPVNRTFEYDERLINEKFDELRAFKQINEKTYVVTENSVLYYKQSPENSLEFVKQLLSAAMMNEGVSEFYHDLYLFPTKKFPERVIVLTTAIFQNSEGDGKDKLLSCFKWFEGQEQEVDGKCTIETRIDIQDFRITGRWAYLRMPDETYVYDETLTMRTRWEQIPTQYIAGHAVTTDHLTYLYKTNELAYYRLVQNFENDDIKMTASDDSLFISKKGKRMIKLNKPPNMEVIAIWLIEIDQTTFKTLIQFNTGDLHCYRIIRSEESTEINYLFRLAPLKQEPIQSNTSQKQENDPHKSNEAENQESGENIPEIAENEDDL